MSVRDQGAETAPTPTITPGKKRRDDAGGETFFNKHKLDVRLVGLQWSLDRRQRILQQLLLLKDLMDHNKKRAAFDWPVFSLFIGVSFSLWRAVFLIDPEEYTHNDVQHGYNFIKLVLRDQIINYPQDRETRGWSTGFYLNNAVLRLQKLSEKIEVPSTLARRINDYWTENIDTYDPFEVFDWCLITSLESFESYVQKGIIRAGR